MSINVHAKTDVSYLFSSLGSGAAGVAGSNLLADYASIKNGSYAKLMKAYYSENTSDSVKSVAKSSNISASGTYLSKEESRKYAQVQTTSDALKESADALLEKSLFTQKDITVKNEDGTETTEKGYDTDAIYKAVNSFVTNYNATVKAAAETDDSSVSRRTANMENATVSNTKALARVGITVGEDGTLSLDKDTFEKADMSKVKSLFNGNGSYGYQVSAQASLINYAADNVINKGSTYTGNGSYSANFSNGNLFSTYF
ncbi:MAG: flagellar filament capping protein FliD [Acetatifactor sp.]